MAKDIDTLLTMMMIPGPSGNEDAVQSHFQRLLEPFVGKQYTDNAGNAYSEIPGHPDKPRIMFTAHADTIGFMVKYIDDMGYIFTEDIGGLSMADPRMLPGTDILFTPRYEPHIEGHVMPVIPYHLVNDEEDDITLMDRAEMGVDIGAIDEDDAKRRIDIGDYAVIKPEAQLRLDQVVGAGLDDRAGLFVMYELAKKFGQLKRERKPTLIFCSTTAEEASAGNSGMAATVAKPDIAITLDMMPTTDTIVHDADFEIYKRHGKYVLRGGPVIARGLGVHDSIFMALEQLAMQHGIPYQVELSKMDTDNQFIFKNNVRTGLVMIPVRNAHTRVETMALKDLDFTYTLCAKLIHHVDQNKLQ